MKSPIKSIERMSNGTTSEIPRVSIWTISVIPRVSIWTISAILRFEEDFSLRLLRMELGPSFKPHDK
ncbi:hypothetical protein BpHYR1_004865 [Brachionus plicatilis]|uniref:Uncharacterized protein n=1 Tax=Brachionus plicatilis TaxID=10195 RepID=A0A3M7SYD8_BRAPC|nr:hypothetical protein BpHYR1_004865 [Brachionus plicatilis]